MNEIYDINNDKYFKKYLKYKIKYLELHNELEGSGTSKLFNDAAKAVTAIASASAKSLTSKNSYTLPKLSTIPDKLKADRTDTNNYIKKLIKIIESYPLGDKIKEKIKTDAQLKESKDALINQLSSLSTIDGSNDGDIMRKIDDYIEKIDNSYVSERDIFKDTINKYKDFAKDIYYIYYDSSVVSYDIIDKLYRKIIQEHKIDFNVNLKIIDYKDNKDNKQTELITKLRSIIPEDSVIPLQDNIILDNDKVTYNINSNNLTNFKSTVLITPNNKYYYELSMLKCFFEDDEYQDEINEYINKYFNIYIHLLYINLYLPRNLASITNELILIIQYIQELLVSVYISYNGNIYTIWQHSSTIQSNRNLLFNLIQVNKLFSDQYKLSSTNSSNLTSVEINLVLNNIKTIIENKRINELIYSIQEKIKLAERTIKSGMSTISSYFGLNKIQSNRG